MDKNTEIKKASFTAANQYPFKLAITECLRDGKIMPLHIQLCPTNKCNQNCSFCSCSERDKTQELSFESIKKVLVEAKECGCIAVTITGGGEFLLHPQADEIIELCLDLGIKIGLVTNGYLLETIKNLIEKITWIRISLSDESDIVLLNILTPIVAAYKTDWSFSYVLTQKPDIVKITAAIGMANAARFTHMRLVSDLFHVYNKPAIIETVKKKIKQEVDDSLVIYQPRSEYTKGVKNCWVSLLKPVIAPDGYIYGCCGVQYAHKISTRTFPIDMRMGPATQLKEIYRTQAAYDGRTCYRCYYSEYNEFLALKFQKLKHMEFV